MRMTTLSLAAGQEKLTLTVTEGVRAFHNLLRHRDLLWQMVGNDLRGRYVGSLLGVLWNVIHPLVMIGIYTIIFSRIMGARLGGGYESPYAFSVYLCAALLPWTTFAEIVNRSTGIFWENANLVKKIAFPKILLHVYVLAASGVNLVILTCVFGVFLWAVEWFPPLAHLSVWLFFLGLQLVFALGIGLCTSVLNVFFRDTAQVTAVALQLWFWFTPIVYVAEVLPPFARELLQYNVMYRFSNVHQTLILRGELPSVAEGLFLLQVSLLTLFVGLLCFRAFRRSIPDEL